MPSNVKTIKETLKGILIQKLALDKSIECSMSKSFSPMLFKVNEDLYAIL
jgi:hypothetical protein